MLFGYYAQETAWKAAQPTPGHIHTAILPWSTSNVVFLRLVLQDGMRAAFYVYPEVRIKGIGGRHKFIIYINIISMQTEQTEAATKSSI